MRLGRRADGRLLGCFFTRDPAESLLLRFGIVVPAKHLNAVRRNRLKRLMKEAIAKQKDMLYAAQPNCTGEVSIVFLYKGTQDLPPDRVKFTDIRQDIAEIFHTVTSKL